MMASSLQAWIDGSSQAEVARLGSNLSQIALLIAKYSSYLLYERPKVETTHMDGPKQEPVNLSTRPTLNLTFH